MSTLFSSGARLLVAAQVGLVLVLAGCLESSDFDRPTEVVDLRVLALRLEPPEIEMPLSEHADPIPVGISALVATPDSGTLQWNMRMCSSATSRGCKGEEEGGVLEHVSSGEVEIPSSHGEVPEIVLEGEISFSVEMIQELLEATLLDGLGGIRPVLDLEVRSGDYSERALKRLQISFPDIAYRLLMAEVGIPICDERGLPEGCLEYRARVPNANPAIEDIAYRRVLQDGSLSDPEPIPEDGPLLVSSGEQVWLVPQAADGSSESYQTLFVDFETHEVRLEDREEILIWSWFATAGRLGRARTEETRTRGEQNLWTAQESAPRSQGDVWIWLVLRDNRGGVDFTSLHLRVD